jgi:hypothetical protein
MRVAKGTLGLPVSGSGSGRGSGFRVRGRVSPRIEITNDTCLAARRALECVVTLPRTREGRQNCVRFACVSRTSGRPASSMISEPPLLVSSSQKQVRAGRLEFGAIRTAHANRQSVCSADPALWADPWYRAAARNEWQLGAVAKLRFSRGCEVCPKSAAIKNKNIMLGERRP